MPAVSTQLNNFIMPASARADRTPAPWLARVRAWFTNFRTRETDREISHFIAQRGGRMTDDLERQIARMAL